VEEEARERGTIE
jgi:hypothetical protein